MKGKGQLAEAKGGERGKSHQAVRARTNLTAGGLTPEQALAASSTAMRRKSQGVRLVENTIDYCGRGSGDCLSVLGGYLRNDGTDHAAGGRQ